MKYLFFTLMIFAMVNCSNENSSKSICLQKTFFTCYLFEGLILGRKDSGHFSLNGKFFILRVKGY